MKPIIGIATFSLISLMVYAQSPVNSALPLDLFRWSA
jgi:hypothetical protein